jgi:hypothetical protein
LINWQPYQISLARLTDNHIKFPYLD